MNFFSYLFFLVLILFARSLSAQDLEAMFKKENLIKVNGGINSSATLYQATGREANRNPFSYNVGGNVNVRLLGNFSFPLSFNYTTNSTTVTQPMFNQFNLAPSYKWVKLYFGSASLNLSSHTLASAPFSGFAFELSPGPWKISGMYGTLKQAVAFNPLNESVEGVFKRTGFGGKVGYKAKGWSAEVAFLKSEDNSASLDYVPTTSKTTPQSNISTQLAFQTKLFKKINLDANYATSGLTRDVRSPNSTESSFSPLKALMDTRTTTVFFNSYSLKASYDLKNNCFL